MIEQIIDGILDDVYGTRYADTEIEVEIKHRWRLIIRKAISESSCSQAMLEETAAGRRS